MTEQPVLRAEGVCAGYGGPPIIEDVSLSVYPGKITAVVGPNGAGKSTLLKTLSGVLKTSRGEVFERGAKATNVTPEKLAKRGLGYVPQVANVFPAPEITTLPQVSGPTAPRPSPPGPMSPASPWLHNHAYRRASLSPSRFPPIYRCQVDDAVGGVCVARSRIYRSPRRLTSR